MHINVIPMLHCIIFFFSIYLTFWIWEEWEHSFSLFRRVFNEVCEWVFALEKGYRSWVKGGRKNEEASVNALVSLQVMIFLLFLYPSLQNWKITVWINWQDLLFFFWYISRWRLLWSPHINYYALNHWICNQCDAYNAAT